MWKFPVTFLLFKWKFAGPNCRIYSQTGRIGNKTLFSRNKILFAKTGRTCCNTMFVVHHQFLHKHIRYSNFFFSAKTSFVFAKETDASMQILRRAYGKKPVHETWRTPTITIRCTSLFRHFILVSTLFTNNV